MNDALFALTSVAVAAVVGGVTNHLAIKMLFHPRRALTIAGRRVPFTPGLIPKRKQEIASSLGGVVADYLVTAEGLRELLSGPAFRDSAVERLTSWIEREVRLAGADRPAGATAGDLLRRWATPERLREWEAALPGFAGEWSARAVRHLWTAARLADKPLREAIPGWRTEQLARWADLAAGWGLKALREQIESPDGQQMLKRLATGLMDRSGGFLGMLAGIFVDEDKLVGRLTPYLVEQLTSESVRSTVAGVIAGRLEELGERTCGEAIRLIADGREPEEALDEWLRERVPWARLLGSALEAPVGRWLSEHNREFRKTAEAAVDAAIRLAAAQTERLIAAVRLPELVQKQVERFPIERLEAIILSVSGKEFRAITWLGALLGGFIGLLQATFWLIWR